MFFKKLTRILHSTILLVILSSHVFSQNDCVSDRFQFANNWLFGEQAGIRFEQNAVLPVPFATPFASPNGVAALSDSAGELLMYSNGLAVYNRDYAVMINGSSLNGNNFATQSALFVPNPGNDKSYYLFTVDMYIPPLFTDGVNYTVIDFSANNLGEVTVKNSFLHSENSQKITGTLHENGKEYWVITHGFGAVTGNVFYVYLVNDTALIEEPIVSEIGYTHQGSENNGAGYMKTSPDGSRLALVVPEDGVVEVFDFDRASGRVTNPVASAIGQFSFAFGLEFSPDNSKLYITTSPLGEGINYLYQIDLGDTNPFLDPYVVEQFSVSQQGSADSLMGAIQLGVDGKIYLSKFRRGILGKSNLGIVYNPNRPGVACNYNSLDYSTNNGLNLLGARSLIGLPNFVNSFLNIPHFTYSKQCHNDTTLFSITNTANIDNTQWEFDDENGDQVIMDELNPGFVYDEPGDYTVTLTETFNNEEYSASRSIRIHPLPFIDLGRGADTLYILPNTSVLLDAGDWDLYFWQPGGSNERYLEVSEEGLYSVSVVDANCCRNADQVYIQVSELYYPTAFRPNSPIPQNAEFKVVGNISALGGYTLQIYDRWGQMIFETNNPSTGWDGTWNGNPLPSGTYVWKSVFKGFEVDGQPGKEFVNRGTVTLIR